MNQDSVDSNISQRAHKYFGFCISHLVKQRTHESDQAD